jgi:hypothetical protein
VHNFNYNIFIYHIIYSLCSLCPLWFGICEGERIPPQQRNSGLSPTCFDARGKSLSRCTEQPASDSAPLNCLLRLSPIMKDI